MKAAALLLAFIMAVVGVVGCVHCYRERFPDKPVIVPVQPYQPLPYRGR